MIYSGKGLGGKTVYPIPTRDSRRKLAEAVRAGRRYGVPVWAWHNWNEFQCIRPGWLYQIDPVWCERPQKYWCPRDGSRFYRGVPAMAPIEVTMRPLAICCLRVLVVFIIHHLAEKAIVQVCFQTDPRKTLGPDRRNCASRLACWRPTGRLGRPSTR